MYVNGRAHAFSVSEQRSSATNMLHLRPCPQHNADVNLHDEQNNSPLHVAAYTGRKEVALCLIDEFNCDPSTTGYLGETLLHKACRGGSVISLVQTLIRKHNADVNARNEENDTPLHVAAYTQILEDAVNNALSS